jgi:uncharacterized surface protein with fasciclin (FAS1) repeats
MIKHILTTTAATIALAMAAPSIAQNATPVGDEATDATVTTPSTPAADTTTSAMSAQVAPAAGTISAAVAGNAELSTLRTALDSAGLTQTLAGTGPFTVFAPTDAAFAAIDPAVRTQLMSPAQRASLETLLKYHVVAGNISSAQLRERITAGGGTATLTTVAGQSLTAAIENGNIVLQGQNGSKAYVTTADTAESNGTIHVVNGILVPRLG